MWLDLCCLKLQPGSSGGEAATGRARSAGDHITQDGQAECRGGEAQGVAGTAASLTELDKLGLHRKAFVTSWQLFFQWVDGRQ